MRQLFTAIIVSKVITAVIADANVIFIKEISSSLLIIKVLVEIILKSRFESHVEECEVSYH